ELDEAGSAARFRTGAAVTDREPVERVGRSGKDHVAEPVLDDVPDLTRHVEARVDRPGESLRRGRHRRAIVAGAVRPAAKLAGRVPGRSRDDDGLEARPEPEALVEHEVLHAVGEGEEARVGDARAIEERHGGLEKDARDAAVPQIRADAERPE